MPLLNPRYGNRTHLPRGARRVRCTICGYGRPPGCCAGESRRAGLLRRDVRGRQEIKDVRDLRLQSRQRSDVPAAAFDDDELVRVRFGHREVLALPLLVTLQVIGVYLVDIVFISASALKY